MDNKDLIRQYVNIGIRLPEYQLNRLSVNDLKTYLRVRIIMVGNGDYSNTTELLSYEYIKMSDSQKDSFIMSIKNNDIETPMMTLNWRGYSDDFVTRLIRLSSTSTIKDNIIYILRNSRSRVSVIYDILNTHGPIFNENRVMSFVLAEFDSDDSKLKFCMEYLKLLSNSIRINMTIINSPITSMLHILGSSDCKTLSKYFISLNLTKPNGDKIDGNTFFTLLNNTSDITFGEVSDFMKANLDLSPNQLVFIDEEMKEKQTPNEQ